MRASIDQLKDQMNQILEALKTLKSSREVITVRNEEAISSHPLVTHLGRLHARNKNTQGNYIPYPQYGMPPIYNPIFEEYLK